MSLRPNPVSGVNEQSDPLFLSSRRVTDHTHVGLGDQILLVDTQARPVTVILPKAAAAKFKSFIVLQVGPKANRVTVSGGGGSLIDGMLNVTIGGQWNGAWFWSDGTSWYLLPGGGV